MKFFDFGAFQINEQMPSHDKNIFHIRFEAFHITPRMLHVQLNKKSLLNKIECGTRDTVPPYMQNNKAKQIITNRNGEVDLSFLFLVV